MVASSPLGLAAADQDGLLVWANDAYCALVGRSLPELVGRSSREWTHPEQRVLHASVAELEAAAEARGERPWLETRYVRPDGSTRWAWVTTARLTGPLGERWTAGYVQDITARRRTEDRLRGAARTDPLTGLLNRRGWSEATRALVGRAGPLTVALLDLDHFKRYNDRLGHRAGDELLRRLGRGVAEVVPPDVPVARWGGEEFAVALAGVGSSAARTVLRGVAELLPAGETLSGGVITLRDGESVSDGLDRADRLLYRAKREGRDRRVTDEDAAGPG